MKRNLNIIFLAALAMSACEKSNFQSLNHVKDSISSIFATNPQNQTQFIALYRLKSPALLQKLNDQKVDKDLAAQIEKEQADFIASAQKISADIKVIYKYRLVLNAVTLLGPVSAQKQLESLSGVAKVEMSGSFARPDVLDVKTQVSEDLNLRNSVKFIGADLAHEQGIRGQGMKVGIIDTGVDYTHAMLGGPGTVEAYKSVDPNTSNALFPNKKVVGGIDLVGTDFDSASANFALKIPHPDSNPMDEAGHGSHVAGTVAGIGDGKTTYSGVAPDASIYAIKVFGANGSTSDEVVIAGLEYAANPKGDLDLTDHLDVINMSLGSNYGTAHIFYSEAIKNLSNAGTVVVASAGNSGPRAFIVGAPSVSEEAISVAASVDNSDHNWRFGAVEFTTPSGKKILVQAIESPIAKPISEAGDVSGSLVYVGLAKEDLSDDVAAQLKGHVALIDRGVVPFADKMKRAEKAGAIGVVVANNQDGEPFGMGGEGSVSIPSIMISKALGVVLKNEMANGLVTIKFQTTDKIETPNVIDTLTGFSSQGPRSLDALIKPEISSPGLNVVSAKLGSGAEGVQMSGTSMAGPHVAGVMALLKQSHPTLSSKELKSILMGTALTIHDEDKNEYPISRQGAGRVQVDQAVKASLSSEVASFSLGEVQLDQVKVLEKEIELNNISDRDLNLKVKFEGAPQLVLSEQTVSISKAAKRYLKLSFRLSSKGLTESVNEVGGWVKFYEGDKEIHRIPTLAMVKLVSQVKVVGLTIDSTSEADSFQSPAHLVLSNKSGQKADVLLFNSLGYDQRKNDNLDPMRSRACDLQAAGYRIINGKIQIAVKTYEPLTTWNTCEVSVQFDTNGDGVADQELVGVPLDHLEGMNGTDYKSILLDAGAARDIRKAYEDKVVGGDHKAKPDYSSSVQSMDEFKVYEHATIAVVQVDLSALKLTIEGKLAMKVATINVEDYAVEGNDFLAKEESKWKKVDSTLSGQSFMNLPELVSIEKNSTQTIDFQKGYGKEGLLVLVPSNQTTYGSLQNDAQALSVKAKYIKIP